eukprot:TRINITY_DN3428_c0_g1_i3.p1 TRINITY_DN3428_c0_g1~~TRINITY_DN3428_c0_g1_i3.p1  ORF type:complete len:117 (-),score=8.45 TRINITY_DN3428_c0_g1_i3:110-460(-)
MLRIENVPRGGGVSISTTSLLRSQQVKTADPQSPDRGSFKLGEAPPEPKFSRGGIMRNKANSHRKESAGEEKDLIVRTSPVQFSPKKVAKKQRCMVCLCEQRGNDRYSRTEARSSI